MKSRLAVALFLCWLLAGGPRAQAGPPGRTVYAPPPAAPAAQPQQQQIHPAVARIVAPGNGSISYGSGTLVYAAEQYGLVVTNWHVINEATGPISVHFPDGFYSIATVQKADRDWDLAILAIRRPNAEPVRLANQAPQPGEMLTIAGYGSGEYRAASGPCTQYVAPGVTFPFEMVEVAASARQGDSGGPIFNSRGELAGVLFGEGNGRTSGSYCGRVRWFLASVAPGSLESAQQIAQAPLTPVAPRPSGASDEAGPAVAQVPALPSSAAQRRVETSVAPRDEPPPRVVASTQAAEPPAVQTHVIGWQDIAGETLGEQIKSVLAAVGVLAVILHVLKWMSTEPAEG